MLNSSKFSSVEIRDELKVNTEISYFSGTINVKNIIVEDIFIIQNLTGLKELSFTDNFFNTVSIVPPTLDVSYTLTLPVNDGTSGCALITDGFGNLSWSGFPTGDVIGPSSSSDNSIARFDGITGKEIQNSSVFIDDFGNLLLGEEGNIVYIYSVDAVTLNANGGSITLKSGNGNNNGDGGDINTIGGDGGINGNGGSIFISGGVGNGTGVDGRVYFPNIRTGVSGNAAAFTGGGELVDSVSLRKYKKDEKTIQQENFNYMDVLDIEPKFYTWINDNVRELGFVVEDIKNNIFLYLDKDTNMPKNIKDRAIIASLLEVVKNQQKDINDLKNIYNRK